MSNLHRTQIYIDEEQMYQLKLEADKEHLTVSEIIRRAIKDFFKLRTKKIDWNSDSLTKSIGRIKLKSSDTSEDHDQYLYGEKLAKPLYRKK
ncbi:MAG: ribbon-helix-helix protein, CopG family [Elusimicrobiota bacterium]